MSAKSLFYHVLGSQDTPTFVRSTNDLLGDGAIKRRRRFVSINVAIVSMVNDTVKLGDYANLNGTCPFPNEIVSIEEPKKVGEFNWDHKTRGVVLSSFYYGYICTQLVGGYLVRRTGARLLYGLAVGIAAILTLMNPMAARIGPDTLALVRLVKGFVLGVTFPAGYHLLAYWAPKMERTIMVILPLTGAHIGTVISGPVTGWLCEYGFAGGWPSAFYVFGSLSLIWCVGWFINVRDTPAEHPTISEEELIFIERHCPNSSQRHHASVREIPWKDIVTSEVVWALMLSHACFNWGYYNLLTEMASYLRDVLHIGAFQNGIVSSLPYFCFFVTAITTATLSDVIRARGVNTATVRKTAFCTGSVLSALFLIIISYIGCDIVAVVTVLCLAVGISGMAQAGFNANHVDLAPQYASILMGITNTMGTIPGILTPLVTGAIINKHSTIDSWQTVFLLSSFVSIFGAATFGMFGQGEIQPWAELKQAD